MPPEKTLRLIRARDVVLRGVATPPRDLRRWALAFTVRDGAGGTVVLAKTTGAGIVVDDPGRGLVKIAVASADTAGLALSDATNGKRYVWDLVRTDANVRETLARGQLVLEGEVAL